MYTDHRGGVRSQLLPACRPQCERPFASYIKVLIQADAFLAVGVQRGAALVPEEPVPMWPCMYAAVGLQPPLDTDTSEGGV